MILRSSKRIINNFEKFNGFVQFHGYVGYNNSCFQEFRDNAFETFKIVTAFKA